MVGTHDYSKKADPIDSLMEAIEESRAVSMTYRSLLQVAKMKVRLTFSGTGSPCLARAQFLENVEQITTSLRFTDGALIARLEIERSE